MIYNLFKYLQNTFPALSFVVDGWEDEDQIESIQVRQTGGDVQHWFVRQDITFQFLSRSESKVLSKQNIELVYNDLRNRFGLTLPANTVGGKTYPALKTAQISPLQVPGYIGTDQNKYHLYSVNFVITVGG